MPNTRKRLANAIRALSMDAVEAAKSGHPGAPMGMADMAEVLWNDFLKHNPKNPNWYNRDRFVLSNGHASMLLYSLLHLSGYDLSLDDIKKFRKLHSKTPGHPEYGITPGVETTTGPLGQGLANAVGMAWAEKALAAEFNRGELAVIDHFTYAFVGDGCLMEGISHEVASLAGTWRLGKLIVFYDDNGISIDGPVRPWFSDDTQKRFEAYGWQVIPHVDGHNSEALRLAIEDARNETERPTLIACRTTIGFGAPKKAGTQHAHGSPLGAEEIKGARANLGWEFGPFEIPEDVRQGWDARKRGSEQEAAWQELWRRYQKQHPALAAELERRLRGELPKNFATAMAALLKNSAAQTDSLATRQSSKQILGTLAQQLPELLGGSADLTESNGTRWTEAKTWSPDSAGNYLFYGVREFGMTAIANGISLHGGWLPFTGTFLMFMEYARNAVRMAALMKLRQVLIYTHDSIGLGEDGPTHQAVEQAAILRLTPNVSVWRPADTFETAVAWQAAIERADGPTALLLSRQGLPQIKRTETQAQNVARGAYVLREGDAKLGVVLVGTGSELSLVLAAADELAKAGKQVRVVSMPCVDIWEKQSAEYQESVIPRSWSRRVVVEAGIASYWRALAGPEGKVIGMNSFGESAPAPDLYKHFGISVENIVATVKGML